MEFLDVRQKSISPIVSNMECETIVVERDTDRLVDYVTLNRPDRLNALSPKLVDELWHYFTELQRKDLARGDHQLEPRVVVLRGSGRAFCAGMDIMGGQDSSLQEASGVQFFNGQRRFSEIIMAMRKCKQPIVGCIQGAAAGGGFALMLACDIRFATEDAKMNVAMAKIGLTGCDIGISYHLPRQAGSSVAAELMMTGRFLTAPRALSLGLISSMHKTKEEMYQACETMVDDMLRLSVLGLALTKEGLNMNQDASSLQAAIALEDRQQLLTLKDPDFMKAIAEFAQGRRNPKSKL